MFRRCLTLGIPLALFTFLLFAVPTIPWEARTAIFAFVAMVLSIEIAQGTTRAAAGYGARGMPIEMAAMMAAMGTGLSIGYAAGMVWHLGWANLAGVLAGRTPGLVMGVATGRWPPSKGPAVASWAA